MKTSAQPTPTELTALNLIVPSFWTVKLEAQLLILDFYSPQDQAKLKPLFSYEIIPSGNINYEGELAAAVIEDLSNTVYTLYTEYAEHPETDAMERVLNIVNGAARSTSERLLTGEYKIMTGTIYTVDETDWFG